MTLFNIIIRLNVCFVKSFLNYAFCDEEGRHTGCTGNSNIRMPGIIDDQVPYVRPISIQTSYTDGSRAMYIDSANKMNPSSTVSLTDESARFEIQYLYMDHIDYYHYTEWAPVVALSQ